MTSLFKATSAFDQPIAAPPPAPTTPPRTVIPSPAHQGPVIEVKAGQLREWWHELDDALADLETTDLRDYDRAIDSLERLKETIDDLVRSTHAPVRSDRHSG